VGSLIVILVTFSGWSQAEEPSQCFGTAADGRLENGWKLPGKGSNFQSYSSSGNLLGRTYVHSTVYEVVLSAYSAVADETPDKKFVYGETGKKSGGEFAPHKTHRNGLSVDFMVPLIDEKGRSVPMRTHLFNKWGYDLEFDSVGRLGRFTIDADVMAEHIYQLHQAALSAGVDIWRIIFDPHLQPMLHSTKRWDYLRKNIKFSERRSWVRHDDHYHVDFAVPCGPTA
jgi:penicillin-insensitive murein endopeptidase